MAASSSSTRDALRRAHNAGRIACYPRSATSSRSATRSQKPCAKPWRRSCGSSGRGKRAASARNLSSRPSKKRRAPKGCCRVLTPRTWRGATRRLYCADGGVNGRCGAWLGALCGGAWRRCGGAPPAHRLTTTPRLGSALGACRCSPGSERFRPEHHTADAKWWQQQHAAWRVDQHGRCRRRNGGRLVRHCWCAEQCLRRRTGNVGRQMVRRVHEFLRPRQPRAVARMISASTPDCVNKLQRATLGTSPPLLTSSASALLNCYTPIMAAKQLRPLSQHRRPCRDKVRAAVGPVSVLGSVCRAASPRASANATAGAVTAATPPRRRPLAAVPGTGSGPATTCTMRSARRSGRLVLPGELCKQITPTISTVPASRATP